MSSDERLKIMLVKFSVVLISLLMFLVSAAKQLPVMLKSIMAVKIVFFTVIPPFFEILRIQFNVLALINR